MVFNSVWSSGTGATIQVVISNIVFQEYARDSTTSSTAITTFSKIFSRHGHSKHHDTSILDTVPEGRDGTGTTVLGIKFQPFGPNY